MPKLANKQNRPQPEKPASPAVSSTPTPAPGHAANRILQLQRTLGNRVVQRLMQPHSEEVEAGSLAAEPVSSAYDVSRVPLLRSATQPTRVQPGTENEEHAGLAESEVGKPPPDALREEFEHVTHSALGSVRLHTGPASQQAAEALQARAFTVGRDVYFAAGQFQPGTPEGDHLLAHELTHTVQQRATAPTPQTQLEVTEPDTSAEIEADEVAEAVLEDDDEMAAPAITEHPRAVSMAPADKKKTAKKPKGKKVGKPKPIRFNLFSTQFKATLDVKNIVTVTKVGKTDGGWVFTPGAANKVEAERAVDHAGYVHADGTTEPLVERCTITVPMAGPATHTPIAAELDSPPKLSIPLSGNKTAANRKAVTANGIALVQLDLPAAAITFTPADGDTIHLGLGGDAWVFTTLHQDPVSPTKTAADVQGFFHVGFFTRYVDHGVPTFGIATHVKSDAERKKEIDDLTGPPTPASRQITGDEAEMFKTVALIESDLAGVQTYDTGILSFGFSQWTVNSDLPRLLLKVDAVTFERFLGRYGLAVGAPARQLDAFVHRFVGPHRARLGVRNTAEGALFLNGKELVNHRLLEMATAQSAALRAVAKHASDAKAELDAARPDLKSTDAAKKTAAVKATADAKKKVDALSKMMVGLAGMKTLKDPSAQAALLGKVATDGATASDDLLANCAASEALRSEEWALRFEMLGQSPGGQDAEVAEVRANWSDVSSKSTHGTAFMTLLPNLRGKATLLSSYLNTHDAASGIGRAVDIFKAQKQSEAKAAANAAAKAKKPAPTPTEADWKAFPWKSSDTRWTTLWVNKEIDEFEAIAIIEMTKPTTSPARRRKIIKAQFP
jgi:hypothetical protein